jgi:hypothetical protein
MHYDLVSDDQFSTFPTDPIEKWLALESACRRSLNELITHSSDATTDNVLRLQYMNMIASAAEELGISGIDVPSVAGNFEPFLMAVTRVSTRLRLKNSGQNHALSVALTRTSKSKLFSQIERLRQLVQDSDLSEHQKKKLFTKLDELYTIVVAPRADFARIMAVVGFIAAGLGGTTAFLADAPEAIATISAVVGEAKEQEEEEQRLLQSEKEQLKIQDMRTSDSSNDEIAF